MKKNHRIVKSMCFPILLLTLFLLLTVSVAAIDTPWITPPEDSETETTKDEETTATTESTIATEPPGIWETATAADSSAPETPIVEITVSENETPMEPATEKPTSETGQGRRKGCGSAILQNGVGYCVAILAITGTFFPKREEKSHGAG